MKKSLNVALISLFLVIFLSGNAFAIVYGQSGYENYGYSESTAWEINSAATLAKVRDDINNGIMNRRGYYKLTKDIDISNETSWRPIGGTLDSMFYDQPERAFLGVFNGNGHKIKINISKNMQNNNIVQTNDILAGLFGVLYGGAVIKNLTVEGNIDVYTDEGRELVVGGIASYLMEGSIENCKFDGNISATSSAGSSGYSWKVYAGGIVGYAGYSYYNFAIRNCKVGSVSSTSITSYSTSDRSFSYAGGIVGYCDDYTYSGYPSEVTGNYAQVTTNAYYKGKIYAGRGRGTGVVANITITKTSLASGTAGDDNYSDTLTAEVIDEKYSVKWSANGLPSWLKLNENTGELTGKNLVSGEYKFTATASITVGDVEVTEDKEFTLTVTGIEQPTYSLTITNASFADGTVGKDYSETLKAEFMGMTIQAAWSATNLPSWLALDSVTGALTGKPTTAGNYTFTVTATAGQFTSQPQTFTIKVAGSSGGGGGGTNLPEVGDEEPPKFRAHQPVLEGQIIVNFFVDFIDNSTYGSSVNFKVLNDTTYNPVQKFDYNFSTDGKYGTYYGFKCCLTSIQMADPITATLNYGNNQTVTETYTLSDYIDKYYSASSSSTELKKLLGAMKDYGHYAQIALEEYHDDWKLGTDHIAMSYANNYTDDDIETARLAVDSYAKSWKVGNFGIQSIGYTLVLDADTALELYLRPASNYTGNVHAYSRGAIGITDTNADLAVIQPDGRYLVQISGIPAHRLDYTNTIRVITDNGSFDIKVSALSYVNTVLNSTKYNDNMKKAVTSLYRYYKATKEYRTSTGQ